MTKRIFRSICLAALVVLLACVVLILGVLYSYFTRVQLQQLRTQTALAVQGVAHEGLGYFDELDDINCRITWIAADGTVIYDSILTSGTMENHLQREEILEALETGYGESIRYSDTIMEQSLYAAMRLQDGTVLRMSNEQDSVVTLLLGMAQPIVLILIVAVVLALVLASRLSELVVKPLNTLNLDAPLSNHGYREIMPLLRRIDAQQKQLRDQEELLRANQKQFDTVTGSMSEGLVLLNNKTTILSINSAAARLLGTSKTCIGSDFLTVNRTSEICSLVYQALNGHKAETSISLATGTYQLIASPVRSGGIVSGVVLLLLDVTEKHKAEALRREFTANVSHELKTPLHAISGYAELIKSGIAKQEDQILFSEKIYAEAQRMIRLVEDILRLSRLDEGSMDMDYIHTDLYDLAQETVRNLSSPAEQAEVSLRVEGSSVMIRSVPQLLQGILYNLTDNAIKYNRPGGSVAISVSQTDKDAVLTVSDTGIGIPKDLQERIFERFFRVDKSRSKEVGGTGLGLSIVKHAASILGASIHLSSSPGEGTVVTITIPK